MLVTAGAQKSNLQSQRGMKEHEPEQQHELYKKTGGGHTAQRLLVYFLPVYGKDRWQVHKENAMLSD